MFLFLQTKFLILLYKTAYCVKISSEKKHKQYNSESSATLFNLSRGKLKKYVKRFA